MKYIISILLAVGLVGCGDIDKLAKVSYELGCVEDVVVRMKLHEFKTKKELNQAFSACHEKSLTFNPYTGGHDQ